MRKALSSFKFLFHDKASNFYLDLSESSTCEVKRQKLYQKAYHHNEKYLENKIKASR